MNWNIIIPIIGVVIAAGVFLFGSGILRKSQRKDILGKNEIFCGIETNDLRIPDALVEEMKNIRGFDRKLGILNIFLKNNSKVACMNPIITIRPYAKIFGHIINDTSEDRTDIEGSIQVATRDSLDDLILKPKRLGPSSFIDLTVWMSQPIIVSERQISFSSDSDFELKTEFISFRSGEEKFK